MGSGYDEFSPRSYATWEGGTKEQIARRDLLRGAMEREGFFVYPWEWWHFEWRERWEATGACPAPAQVPEDAPPA